MSEKLQEIWEIKMPKEKEKSLRKQAFRALAVFFLLLLLFTVLSRAANTFTMTEVMVTQATRRTIDHVIRQEGTIEADRVRGLFMQGGIHIEAVHVGPGSLVEVGDPLLTLNEEHLRDIIGELEHQLQVMDLRIDDEIYNQELVWQQSETAQERAQEDYNTMLVAQNRLVSQAHAAMIRAWQDWQDFWHQPLPPDVAERCQETERMLWLAYEAAEALYEQAIATREEQIRLGERQIADSHQESPRSSTLEIALLEREQLEDSRQEYQTLLEQGGVIPSPMTGTVISLDASVSVGGMTPQTAFIQIADTEAGFIFVATIDRGQQRHISLGDAVTLALMGGGQIADLRIETMTRNPGDEELMDVTVLVPATDQVRLFDVATMRVEGEARNFSTTIPLSALHPGGAGQSDFVLVVREESTILGTQTVVDQIAVTVLDRNDRYVALSDHDLGSEQWIIIFAEGEVRRGDRVIVEDESR